MERRYVFLAALVVALVLIPAAAMAVGGEASRDGPPLTVPPTHEFTVPPTQGNSTDNPPLTVPPTLGNSTNNPPKLDVNGNGRRDFADVTVFFNQLGELARSGSVADYDYNGNGRIDFGDVVWLFKNLG